MVKPTRIFFHIEKLGGNNPDRYFGFDNGRLEGCVKLQAYLVSLLEKCKIN